MTDRLLVALDVDGTVIHEDETLSPAVAEAIAAAEADGHEVMLATGRSWATAQPILARLGIRPAYVVCSNGAVTLAREDVAEAPRDPRDDDSGYLREFVEVFDPSDVLETIAGHLAGSSYMVEDAWGNRRYTEGVVDWSLEGAEQVGFDDLATTPASRVVVVSPEDDDRDFLAVVERMGLHRVSYSVGWTAWLDLAPEGVTKATALERVRERLGIPRSLVLAVGDGRNDIDMLEWAAAGGGRGAAMGQAPGEVLAAANLVIGSVEDDGLAELLGSL